MKPSIIVMVELETDDPRLLADSIDVSTVQAVTRLRQAVVDALPGMSRLVAVMPVETARLMMAAHEHAVTVSGADAFVRPPAAYVPPRGR